MTDENDQFVRDFVNVKSTYIFRFKFYILI